MKKRYKLSERSFEIIKGELFSKNEYSKYQDKLTTHRRLTGGENLLKRILFFMFIWVTVGSALITVAIITVSTVSPTLADFLGTVSGSGEPISIS